MFGYKITIEGNGVVCQDDMCSSRKEANTDAKEMCKHLMEDRLNSEGEANLTWDVLSYEVYEVNELTK